MNIVFLAILRLPHGPARRCAKIQTSQGAISFTGVCIGADRAKRRTIPFSARLCRNRITAPRLGGLSVSRVSFSGEPTQAKIPGLVELATLDERELPSNANADISGSTGVF